MFSLSHWYWNSPWWVKFLAIRPRKKNLFYRPDQLRFSHLLNFLTKKIVKLAVFWTKIWMKNYWSEASKKNLDILLFQVILATKHKKRRKNGPTDGFLESLCPYNSFFFLGLIETFWSCHGFGLESHQITFLNKKKKLCWK